LAKRGRKPKIQSALQIDPTTIREVAAVVLVLLGVIGLLAIFNAGGRVGVSLKGLAVGTFGWLGFFVPIIMAIIGLLMLSPEHLSQKKKVVIGSLFGFLILGGILGTHGGHWGQAVLKVFRGAFGPIGSFAVLIVLLVMDIAIVFGTTMGAIFNRFNFFRDGDKLPSNVKVIEPSGGQERVSVFTTVKRRIGWGGKSAPASSQMPLPVSSSSLGETWEYPSLDLLELSNTKASSGNIAKNIETIKKTLTDFGIDVAMGDVNVGPTVTQYQLKPQEGIKLNQITTRSEDLALSLAAHPVRIEAPIPGKAAVGVEVPNKVTAKVSLRQVLNSETFKKKSSNLTLALGLDVAGKPIVVDLKKLPHVLIAGATGSGKSVCINAVVTTLLYQNSPAELRLLMVDPKRVEFTSYNGIPHLLAPVIVDVDKTINTLKWAVAEMDRRFRVFQEIGARNLETYNEEVKTKSERMNADGQKAHYDTIPNIVIVIDELADLMAQAANEVEAAIVRLAQMARATGIHLVVATQRPSVNVITGLIKANIPARISFAVASQVDSRTIIDQSGAEKLLGNGDMLYIGAETTKPKRIQGVLVNDKEIRAVTDFLKRNGHVMYDPAIMEYKPEGGKGGVGGGSGEDAMYEDAKEVVVRAGKASASLLQRRLKVGYARAARLLDILEENGVIGPGEGAKPRDVYLDTIDLDAHRAASSQSHGAVPSNDYSGSYQEPSSHGGGSALADDGGTWPRGVPKPSAPPPEAEGGDEVPVHEPEEDKSETQPEKSPAAHQEEEK
jgi:S-DNA-T family DNA segregation ATPase FtsK/SpoIIIE